MNIIIIDYGSGNLRSVAKAVEHVTEGGNVTIATDPGMLQQASHIILPGVGAYADCMRGLQAIPGMIAALQREVLEKQTPFLGICVGMQMLFEHGHEHGTHQGLGWLQGEVVRLQAAMPLKIPHMGWNELHFTQSSHPLLQGIQPGAHAYFVHSYHARCTDQDNLVAITDYGGKVTAVVAKGNIMGTQFHPEKSQETGLQLLKNFLQL